MKSIQPLIKGLDAIRDTHTGYYCTQTSDDTASKRLSFKRGGKSLTEWPTVTFSHVKNTVIVIVRGKNTPKVNLFVTRHVWTGNESTKWTLLCPVVSVSRCGNGGKSSSARREIDAAVCCPVFHIYRQLK